MRLNHLSVLLAATVLTTAGAANAAAPAKTANHCFFITEWQGWSSPSPSVLLLGVRNHDVYRVDLAAPAPALSWPGMHLVSVSRGGGSVCAAIDLDLKVADTEGFPQPLFPKTLTKLTPEEVAAIPPKNRPN